MEIWEDIKKSFHQGNNVTKLIYINLGVFILIRLFDVILKLFQWDIEYLSFLQMPASAELLLQRPWTVFTYMFLHVDFFHVLFNILYLYWFGQLFLSFYNQKQLVGLYLIGGILGAFCYFIAYHLFPYFNEIKDKSFLLGASASALAIMMATAATAPNKEIQLVLIGKIKLKYMALFFFIIDLLSITSFNSGGHIAHLGGIFAGYYFAFQMKKGKDITTFINKAIDFIFDKFRKKPKMKVTYKNTRPMTDLQYKQHKKEESEQIDIILDKIKKSGYESLSKEEKKALFEQSNKN